MRNKGKERDEREETWCEVECLWRDEWLWSCEIGLRKCEGCYKPFATCHAMDPVITDCKHRSLTER
jgi:hypothetical protein